MIKNCFFLVACVLLCLSCKKQETPITHANVREILLKYGKDNPENEVVIRTSFGTMRIKLYDDTPLHRANFIKLIKEGHYDEADFYRIAYEFMIQGGNVLTQPNYTVPAEIKHIHKKGALSMARMDENNPEMESSAAEFFIIHGSRYTVDDVNLESQNLGLTLTPEQKEIYLSEGGYMALDGKYSVFGEVVEGFETIDKIASQKVFNEDKPLTKIPLEIEIISTNQN